jgi:hypothetical protein
MCCRHELWKLLLDLQLGERSVLAANRPYLALTLLCRAINMDILVALGICDLKVPVTLSYDINCQWGKKLVARWRATLPPEILPGFDFENDLDVKLPKMHIKGHQRSCHCVYNLNYTADAGRFCGECIERLWAVLNPAAPSTREMTPGRRADALNMHLRAHNWRKHVRTGARRVAAPVRALIPVYAAGHSLAHKMLESMKLALELKEELDDLTDALRIANPKELPVSEAAYAAWKGGDRSAKPPPFEQKLSSEPSRAMFLLAAHRPTFSEITTLANILAGLLKSGRDSQGGDDGTTFEDSPVGFLLYSLHLEIAQCMSPGLLSYCCLHRSFAAGRLL